MLFICFQHDCCFVGSAKAKQQRAEETELGDEESEEEEVGSIAEDQEDSELETEEDLEEDKVHDIIADDIMPSTPTRPKRTPKKTTPASCVDEVTSSLKKLSVNSSSSLPFQFNCVYPYTVSTYDEGYDEM
jgi:hypothetical protein